MTFQNQTLNYYIMKNRWEIYVYLLGEISKNIIKI